MLVLTICTTETVLKYSAGELMGVAGLYRRGSNRAEAHQAAPDTTGPRCLLCIQRNVAVISRHCFGSVSYSKEKFCMKLTFLPDVVKQMFDHMSVHSWIQESVEGFVYSEIRQHVLKNTEMISPSPRLVSLTLTTAVCVELPDR